MLVQVRYMLLECQAMRNLFIYLCFHKRRRILLTTIPVTELPWVNYWTRVIRPWDWL